MPMIAALRKHSQGDQEFKSIICHVAISRLAKATKDLISSIKWENTHLLMAYGTKKMM